MTAAAEVPRQLCTECRTEVPAGTFCGRCGSELAVEDSAARRWLRPRTFGAAPAEAVLAPHLASTLFPQLPSRSRTPFRWALAIATLALAASVAARLPAAGIAVSALGLPLLFVLYLRSSNINGDLPRMTLFLASALGAALGGGWVLLTGGLVAGSLNVSLGIGLAVHHLLGQGVAIPAAGMLLMLAPTVAVRLTRPAEREAMDGFTVGALTALVFTVAATLTRLAPQFTTGLFAHARPLRGLVVEVVMTGITIPATAAAAGGLFGVLLWFRPAHPADRRVRTVLGLMAAAVILVHTSVGVVDLVGLPELVMLTGHLVAAVLALLVLRLALQLALLHQTRDPIREDRQLLCVHCEMVVPDMAFCPSCGAATRACTRTTRRRCREVQSEPPGHPDRAGEQDYPGYAVPAGSYLAPAIERPRLRWLLGRWGTGVIALAAVLAAVALALAPKIAHFMCPPECGRPPSGTPVTALPRFTATDGTFSVAYPAPGSAYQITTLDNGVVARYVGGDTGVMHFFGQPAGGRSARDIVRATLANRFPDASVAYEIPNAMVGFEPGYGVFADNWPQNAAASFSRQRIMVMASVKNDVALVAFASGPYRAFGPDAGPGLPSGANLELAQDLGKYVNSFQWARS